MTQRIKLRMGGFGGVPFFSEQHFECLAADFAECDGISPVSLILTTTQFGYTTMRLKHLRHFALVAAGFLALSAHQTTAMTVTNAVYLGIDSSGSIPSSDFALQRDAYEFLLGATPTDGSRAIGFLQFSTSVQEVFPLTQITSQSDLDALTSTIGGLTQINGATDIAGGIDTAAAALTSAPDFDCASDEVTCAIDISTDGQQTVLGSPDLSADNAVAAGVDQVNCLGVGFFTDCSFIEGDGAFEVLVDDFSDFEAALGQKLLLEGAITDIPVRPDVAPVPLPASAFLLLAGLGGIRLVTRRRTQH